MIVNKIVNISCVVAELSQDITVTIEMELEEFLWTELDLIMMMPDGEGYGAGGGRCGASPYYGYLGVILMEITN